MKRFKIGFTLAALFVTAFFTIDYVSADWKAGNRRSTAYGVRANIWTPINPIYLEESGQSNWVSLPLPHWIQAGWRCYLGYNSPKSYVEYCKSPCQNDSDYFILEYQTQDWGTIKEYKVDHYQSTTWCASIDGTLKECAITINAPAEMQVMSEVHINSNNELDTRFLAVYYRIQNGTWFLFDQEVWMEQYPYNV